MKGGLLIDPLESDWGVGILPREIPGDAPDASCERGHRRCSRLKTKDKRYDPVYLVPRTAQYLLYSTTIFCGKPSV